MTSSAEPALLSDRRKLRACSCMIRRIPADRVHRDCTTKVSISGRSALMQRADHVASKLDAINLTCYELKQAVKGRHAAVLYLSDSIVAVL